MSNPDFNAIMSTTLKNYRTTLADNVTGHHALLEQMKKLGFIEEREGGTLN